MSASCLEVFRSFYEFRETSTLQLNSNEKLRTKAIKSLFVESTGDKNYVRTIQPSPLNSRRQMAKSQGTGKREEQIAGADEEEEKGNETKRTEKGRQRIEI